MISCSNCGGIPLNTGRTKRGVAGGVGGSWREREREGGGIINMNTASHWCKIFTLVGEMAVGGSGWMGVTGEGPVGVGGCGCGSIPAFVSRPF